MENVKMDMHQTIAALVLLTTLTKMAHVVINYSIVVIVDADNKRYIHSYRASIPSSQPPLLYRSWSQFSDPMYIQLDNLQE